MKFFVFYIATFIGHFIFSEDALRSECKDELISIVKEYNSRVKNVGSNNVIYVHYKVNTIHRKNVNKAGIQEVKAYIGKEKSKVINDYTEIYSNNEYTISVMPKDKVMLITNLPKNRDTEWRNKLSLSMLDSIFIYYYVKECTSKNNITHISLYPTSNAKGKFNVNSVEITLNENQRMLNSVKMNMGNKGDIQSMQMEYLAFEEKSMATVSFPSLPDGFVKNGKPSEKFKSYKIIDKTKKKS